MRTKNTRMPVYIRNISQRHDKIEPKFDPRLPISRHILWQKSTSIYAEYSTPEPNNYNRAIVADRFIECEFIEDNVFYREVGLYFSVYYVPTAKLTEFDLWILDQPYYFRWHHPSAAEPRPRRHLLHNRSNAPELSVNERLFNMGYYAKLGSKYFSDNDTMLLERLGPARAEALEAYDDV